MVEEILEWCDVYCRIWNAWLSLATEQRVMICTCSAMTEHEQIII